MNNLSEILYESVLQSVGVGTDDAPGNDDDDAGPGGGGHWKCSYHCPSFKTNGKCDFCSHLLPLLQEKVCHTRTVTVWELGCTNILRMVVR